MGRLLAALKESLGFGPSLQDKPLAEPELLKDKSRPMSGFFAGLTREQQERALAFRGNENLGDPALRRRRA